MVNTSGTISVAQGVISQGYLKNWPLDSAGNVVVGQYGAGPSFPPVPEKYVPFAYMAIKNGSTGSSWIFGTNNWNATGITVVTQDFNTLPDRPQNS
jgi:hypothetical protein